MTGASRAIGHPCRYASIRILTTTLILTASILSTGCATPGTIETEPDPLVAINRPLYSFNDGFDRFLLRPAAVGYDWIMPSPFQRGVGNFFDNFLYPVTILNSFLQGKFRQGLSDTGRFVVNTTVGLLGFFDPATPAGLPYHDEDFGQTLAVWGVPEGPYLVVPILGPRTTRHAFGTVVDFFTSPLVSFRKDRVYWGLVALLFVERRAALLNVDEQVRDAFDPYLFVKDAYLQNREFKIFDGNPPEQFFDDFEDFDDFENFEDEDF